jgi:molybdenum cofactor cytidylyltransferase
MPELSPGTIDRMISAFSPADARAICIATSDGKRGNPVLWARRFFAEIEAIAGDKGAKHLLTVHDDLVCEIEADESVLRDVDTPDALAMLKERLSAVSAP